MLTAAVPGLKTKAAWVTFLWSRHDLSAAPSSVSTFICLLWSPLLSSNRHDRLPHYLRLQRDAGAPGFTFQQDPSSELEARPGNNLALDM